MISYGLYSLMLSSVLAVTLIDVPVTFYLGELVTASTDTDEALYYHVELCQGGVADKPQATLQFYSEENPGPVFNTTLNPYIVAQVSVCNNRFDGACVIATNYQFGVQVTAISNISWQISSNETDYYIRVMGQYKPSSFSMELQFTEKSENARSFPWTTNLPFNTPGQSNQNLKSMIQYWKFESLQTVPNDNVIAFALGYCYEQESTVKQIDVSLSAIPDPTDYSLLTQWACPQSTPVEDCTESNAQIVGWMNQKISSFNLLQCLNQGSKTTKDGIYVVVSGNGANLDGNNHFYLYAITDE